MSTILVIDQITIFVGLNEVTCTQLDMIITTAVIYTCNNAATQYFGFSDTRSNQYIAPLKENR